MKKVLLFLLALFMLTACSKDEGKSITFKTGEEYKFEELSVLKVVNDDGSSTFELFKGKDNPEKEKEILDLLSNLNVTDEEINNLTPNQDSLVVEFKTGENYDDLIMYSRDKDINTGLYHYTFDADIDGGKKVTLTSDVDLIGKILEIVEK